MTLYHVVSDKPVAGDKSQSVSGRGIYSCSIKYLALDSTAELEAYEFDDYEEFLEDDGFRQNLISEIEVRPTPFVFGDVDDLYLGVVDNVGKVIWSTQVAELLGDNSISATFNPESMEFMVEETAERPGFQAISMGEMNSIRIPQEGFLVKSFSFEEDSPELPIELDGDSFELSNLQIVVTYGELITDNCELIGIYWRGQPLEIYGTGGAGSTVRYSTFSLNGGDACEIDI